MTEQQAYDRLRRIEDAERISHSERGFICKEVHDSLLHRERTDPDTGEPCSFSRWLRLAAPASYSTCWQAMRDIEELSDVPREKLSAVASSNFGILKQLSTAVRNDPEVLRAAQMPSPQKLVEMVREKHPDQHIEASHLMRFRPTETEAQDIEEALTLAMERTGATSRTEALRAICIDYTASTMIEDALQKENR